MPEEQTEFTNVTRVIHIGPCEVDDVTLAGDGAAADCQVYDGTNAQGKLKIHLEAISGTTFSWSPTHHANFHFGIYIVVNAGTSKVTVMFNPKSSKVHS